VLGGSKISGKIDVVEALLPKVDHLLVGGAMACTFFARWGSRPGVAREPDRVDLAREVLGRAGEKLVLPTDAGRRPGSSRPTRPRARFA
jgi:phosphoglycerate kinase